MIEEFIHNGNAFAIIVRRDFNCPGINFFTPNDYSQQLAYMKRPKNYVIPPHVHNLVQREVNYTQEVLVIKSGKIRVDFYNNDKTYIESRILTKGDIILLASGGHGFKMIDDSEIIEVKQGPYAGELDKVRFQSVGNEDLNIKE